MALRITHQQAVNNAIHVADASVELQLKRIAAESVTAAQYPYIAICLYPIINDVVIRLI